MDDNISYLPSDGLTYDPEDPKYWDKAALQKEITRTFEICHGCRMCFKYCDSFPSLFDLIDKKHDGDVRRIDDAENAAVMNQCFQCKLCDVQCPYTPRDNHEYQLDFPKLVHRYWAQRAATQDETSLRDKVFSNPDQPAKVARMSFGLANTMNRVNAHRWLLEKVLGIHREKQLPEFAQQTFESWAEDNGKIQRRSDSEAVLFQTCYVQNNEPQIGRDTVEVFEKNQVDLNCVKGLTCCGMPAWERGQLDKLREMARNNLDILMPFVENGSKVVAINPTCSMMMRREYPELLAGEDRERAKKLSEAISDPGEFLWSIRKEERFNTQFKSSPNGPVAYHAPCHLRAQSVGFKSRDLLRKIPGVKPKTVMECCGHDGTYAMTVQGFEPSKRIGKKSFDGMNEAKSEIWATDCPLAAIQFEQHANTKPMHPMTILAKAYRADGFEEISPKDEDE
jgi:glycerol-3-phosphate dehydrogenase subunit C